jgi:hypothetical protein
MPEKEPKTTDKPAKKKKHKVKGMHVRKADSGGFISNHEMLPGEDGVTPPSQEHVIPDVAGLKQHMEDHFGEDSEETPAS